MRCEKCYRAGYKPGTYDCNIQQFPTSNGCLDTEILNGQEQCLNCNVTRQIPTKGAPAGCSNNQLVTNNIGNCTMADYYDPRRCLDCQFNSQVVLRGKELTDTDKCIELPVGLTMVEGCNQAVIIQPRGPPYTQENLYCLSCDFGYSLIKKKCQNEYKGGCSLRDDSGKCQECHVVGTTEFCTGYNTENGEVTCKSKPGSAPQIVVNLDGRILIVVGFAWTVYYIFN